MYLRRDVQYYGPTRTDCGPGSGRDDCQLHRAGAEQCALGEYRPSVATTGGLTLPRFP